MLINIRLIKNKDINNIRGSTLVLKNLTIDISVKQAFITTL